LLEFYDLSEEEVAIFERLRDFSGLPRREWIRNPSWFGPDRI